MWLGWCSIFLSFVYLLSQFNFFSLIYRFSPFVLIFYLRERYNFMAEANYKKVCVLGHSFVSRLEGLQHTEGEFSDKTPYEVRYFHRGGSCYKDWLDWPEELHSAVDWEPHFVFILLGGNSIKTEESVLELKSYAKTFVRVLKNSLPNAKIIPVQIEARFLDSVHPVHGTPAWPEFKLLRNSFNKYLQKHIKDKHLMCIIAGPRNLDSREWYGPDRIHLNNAGNRVLLNIILSTLRFAYDQSKN